MPVLSLNFCSGDTLAACPCKMICQLGEMGHNNGFVQKWELYISKLSLVWWKNDDKPLDEMV
jgi:hypothetical protein